MVVRLVLELVVVIDVLDEVDVVEVLLEVEVVVWVVEVLVVVVLVVVADAPLQLSSATPFNVVVGLLKLAETVEVKPVCLYTTSLELDVSNKFAPSHPFDFCEVVGLLKLAETVEVKPVYL